ncbi:nucleotidyl transferase AbiEii/AbiGii toxin family protein [Pedobacter sp. GSP4]|uniref:nucleotidyl transferase AbiEii/AbiGii toxin family protein n=1 Tax=Pedobacter sp. GSP4 TaxID=3453716 RepID=UPI003EEF15F9
MYWNTVNQTLKKCLLELMQAPELSDFRLVGGTALSLYLGHRLSIDIDLFTDAEYGSIDFNRIEKFLKNKFPYVQGNFGEFAGLGKSYLIGAKKDEVVKLDLFYSMDPFFEGFIDHDGVRMASIPEITAMKVDIVQRGGRKKDFWDLHELLSSYSLAEMINLHQKRFEWTHDPTLIRKNFSNFSMADDDFDPICLKGKIWEFIKEDLSEAIKSST